MISNVRSSLENTNIHKQIKSIKLSIQQVDSLSKQILSLSTSFGSRRKQEAQDRIELVQIQIKQKIKNVAFNIDQMVTLIDYKLSIITAYLSKMQNSGQINKNLSKSNFSASSKTKNQVDETYQIKQLEDRIYDHQLKQKENAKQIQQLKQKNKKLMEEFSKLSLHSNKKIVELSEQLYNNTSPNLTIRGRNLEVENPQISYIASQRNQPIYNRRQNQQHVKTKFSPFQNQYKNSYKRPTANILSGLVSDQSSFDKDFELEQSSTQGLRFGCIPTKNNTQKTKTGSSSINKKESLEQRSDKKRRFDFLLNNLNKQSNNVTNVQQARYYGSQCDSYKQQKSVFQSNVVKRYQI